MESGAGKGGNAESAGRVFPANFGLVYLGMGGWDGPWHNRHFLLRRLARVMPVLYVEPWLRVRQLARARTGPTGRGQTTVFPVPMDEDDGVRILQRSVFHPVANSGPVGRLSLSRWLRRVRRAMSGMGITHPILWVEHPAALPVVGHLDEVLSVYYIIDEYGGYTGLTDPQRARLAEREQALLQRVDLSIAVSEELRRAKAKDGQPIRVVPNAVDFEVYADAANRGPSPDDLAGIPRPVIGHCGLVGARLALERIEQVVVSRPDYQFVFVGRIDPRECRPALSRLANRPNVHFLGEKHGARVPGYLARFDVGLMPYKPNLETRFISPVKLYQYLAAGIPVVSTEIPATTGLRHLIRVAGPGDDLAAAIDRALDEDGGDGRDARMAFAARNTWNQRVATILQIMQAALTAKREEPKSLERRKRSGR